MDNIARIPFSKKKFSNVRDVCNIDRLSKLRQMGVGTSLKRVKPRKYKTNIQTFPDSFVTIKYSSLVLNLMFRY